MDEQIKQAACYVAQNLEPWEIEEGWYYISNREPIPADLEAKIYDLLEEYGVDNDLPECWWGEYGEIEDIFMLIEND